MKQRLLITLLSFLLTNFIEASTSPLETPPQRPSLYNQILLQIYNIEGYFLGRPTVTRHDLPPCFDAEDAIGSEWGERNVAAKWTKGFCHSVLEFGGSAGSVSTVIQMSLENKKICCNTASKKECSEGLAPFIKPSILPNGIHRY